MLRPFFRRTVTKPHSDVLHSRPKYVTTARYRSYIEWLGGTPMAICISDNLEDPVQKLKALHDWLIANKITIPQHPKPTFTQPAPDSKYGAKAAAEAEDFRSWIHEIQSAGRAF